MCRDNAANLMNQFGINLIKLVYQHPMLHLVLVLNKSKHWRYLCLTKVTEFVRYILMQSWLPILKFKQSKLTKHSWWNKQLRLNVCWAFLGNSKKYVCEEVWLDQRTGSRFVTLHRLAQDRHIALLCGQCSFVCLTHLCAF